jgi:hypothetical protein
MLRFVPEQMQRISHNDSRDLKGCGMSLLVPENLWRRHSRAKLYVSVGTGDSLCREIVAYLSEGENLSQEP